MEGTPDKPDLNYLNTFAKGDPAIILKYIKLFLDSAPALLTGIEQALQTSDHGKLLSAIHTLKPQLQFMGISQAFHQAKTTEVLLRKEQVITEEARTEAAFICSEVKIALSELEEIKRELS